MMDSHAPPRALTFIVTCEHGGNRVPARYQSLFEGHETLLRSHRGHDPGAATVARELAQALHCPAVTSATSRLLIDLNRSLAHPALFSEITRQLSKEQQEELIEHYYLPYRHRVIRIIDDDLRHGRRIVHISSHSFTPNLADRVRNADIGLLYDPSRAGERALCRYWIAAMRQRAPSVRLRRNYPYTGRSDGFCTWLRRRYSGDSYVGIELEINQRHALAGGLKWRLLRSDVVSALLDALEISAAADATAFVMAPTAPTLPG